MAINWSPQLIDRKDDVKESFTERLLKALSIGMSRPAMQRMQRIRKTIRPVKKGRSTRVVQAEPDKGLEEALKQLRS